MSSTNRVVVKRATDRQLEHVAGLNVPALKQLRDALDLTTSDVKRFTANADAVETARQAYMDMMIIAFRSQNWRPGFELRLGEIQNVNQMRNAFHRSPNVMATGAGDQLLAAVEYSQERKNVQLVFVTNEQLGLAGNEIPYKETVRYALLQGLKPCDSEDGPTFALQAWTHEFKRSMVIRMAVPLQASRMFVVSELKGREKDQKCLDAVIVSEQSVFTQYAVFAFRLPSE